MVIQAELSSEQIVQLKEYIYSDFHNQRFDDLYSDHRCNNLIQLATDLGFNDLATELKNDLT